MHLLLLRLQAPAVWAVLSLGCVSCLFQTHPVTTPQEPGFSISLQDPQGLLAFDSLRVTLIDSSSLQSDTLFQGRPRDTSDLQNLRPQATNGLQEAPIFHGSAWLTLEGYRDSARTYVQTLALDVNAMPLLVSRDMLRLDRLDYVGPPRFSSDLVFGINLVLDGMDIPHLAFVDAADQHQVKVMRLNQAQSHWEPAGQAPHTEGSAGQLRMVAAKTGELFIAFNAYADSVRSRVRHLRPRSNTWEDLAPASLPLWSSQLALAIGPDDQPYLAYKEEDSGWKASVMRHDSSLQQWVPVGALAFTEGPVNFLTLAISPQGVAYVAFYDENLNGRATVMRCTPESKTWELVGPAGFTAIKSGETTLRIAPDETPYLAYADHSVEGMPARVMRFREGKWQPVLAENASPGSVYDIDLAIDSTNQALVAFSDVKKASGLTLMRENAHHGYWDTLGAAGTSAGSALSIALALDSQGRPWIAFAEGLSNRLSVMRWMQD
jgi:hypothetical protein